MCVCDRLISHPGHTLSSMRQYSHTLQHYTETLRTHRIRYVTVFVYTHTHTHTHTRARARARTHTQRPCLCRRLPSEFSASTRMYAWVSTVECVRVVSRVCVCVCVCVSRTGPFSHHPALRHAGRTPASGPAAPSHPHTRHITTTESTSPRDAGEPCVRVCIST